MKKIRNNWQEQNTISKKIYRNSASIIHLLKEKQYAAAKLLICKLFFTLAQRTVL